MTRASDRRARARRAARAFGALLGAAALAGTHAARAAEGRLVVGTSDPALVAALSVAVSSRGLSVVERAEPLSTVEDVAAAREEVLVPRTVAVVWLCTDGGASALCYCDHEGRLVVEPSSVRSPLEPADAAAVALSVKMLLWGAAPRATPPPPPPPQAPPVTTTPPTPPLDAAASSYPPRLAFEVMAGARLQSPADQAVAARASAKVTMLVGREGSLGVGAGLGAGPSFDVGAGRRVNDLAFGLFGRGRHRLVATELQLDAGPTLHVLGGAGRRAELSADVLLGLVVPIGRAFVGVRAGGFVVVTSASGLPRWSAEAALTAGLTFP